MQLVSSRWFVCLFTPRRLLAQKIETPGRSEVGFITQFHTVCCYLYSSPIILVPDSHLVIFTQMTLYSS